MGLMYLKYSHYRSLLCLEASSANCTGANGKRLILAPQSPLFLEWHKEVDFPRLA